MLSAVLISIVVFVLIFAVMMKVLPMLLSGDKEKRTQNALRQIMEETQNVKKETASTERIFKEEIEDSAMMRLLMNMPGGYSLLSLILKAGYGKSVSTFIIVMLLLALMLFLLANSFVGEKDVITQAVAYIIAIMLAYLIPIKFLEGRIKKRNAEFINMFPDVLDMIVRSVRSGFPLNTAIQMVAENMEPPVSTEFQQVADEVALGRSLDDALNRLAERIDEPDINFFVVVLNVQQETGGNLAEVIGNLSSIIRKRKQLRLKIKAMTSEGRATGWVLGSLPVGLFLVLKITSPTHLDPLFDTPEGNMLLLLCLGLLGLTFWIVRQMLDIDI